MLQICGQESIFGKSELVMERKEKIFEQFGRILEEYSPQYAEIEDFGDICRKRLGVPPGVLDEILLEELGMSGDEIIAEYRRKMRCTIDIGDKNY